VGRRFAQLAAVAQFAYMVLFSYSFFFEGLTGLAITIGAIITLALLMAATAKVNWADKFAAKAMPRDSRHRCRTCERVNLRTISQSPARE
jgi:hypothetical protein